MELRGLIPRYNQQLGRHPRQGEKQKCELRARRNLEHAQWQPLGNSSTIVDDSQSPSREGRVAWFPGLARYLQRADIHCQFPMNQAFETTLNVPLEWLPRRFRLLDARFCSFFLLRNFR
jgi:hypothetical protein